MGLVKRPLGGDVILYYVNPESSWASKFVAVGELLLRMGRGRELYSHCAIVDFDADYQLEAYWPRTRRSRIDPARPYEVWRLKGESEAQRKSGVFWCYAHLGQLYNMVGLLFGWLRIRFHERYCSEFVRAAKEHEGFRLPADDRGYFSPNQLADYLAKHGTLIHVNRGRP